MERQEIIKKLLSLFVNKYEIVENLFVEENFDKPLTGLTFKFDGISLVYLFFDLQNEFKIHIDAEQILNYEFNTINGIIELIENKVA